MLGGLVMQGLSRMLSRVVITNMEYISVYRLWLQLFRPLESWHGPSIHQYLFRKHCQRPDPE